MRQHISAHRAILFTYGGRMLFLCFTIIINIVFSYCLIFSDDINVTHKAKRSLCIYAYSVAPDQHVLTNSDMRATLSAGKTLSPVYK